MAKDKDKDKTLPLEEKVHSAFLSDEEKEKIRQEVVEELDAENKKRVADDYKKTLISAAKRKALLKDAVEGDTGNGLVPVFIDLPKVSECIRIDGTSYHPGRTYNVLPATRELILEIMHRGNQHEDEVTGRKDSNAGRNRNPLATKI